MFVYTYSWHMCSNKSIPIFLLICVWLCNCTQLRAQDTITISGKNFGKFHEISLRDKSWLFHPEPVRGGGEPALGLFGWQPLHFTGFGKATLPAGWHGIGWFAIWLKAGPELANRKLGLRINHDGASEMFIDGKPIGGYGKLGRSAQEMEAVRAPWDLTPLWFSDGRPHLLTIHYANHIGVYPDFYGFEVLLVDYQPFAQRMRHKLILYQFAPICAAAGLILGLLHLLLFFFYPQRKLNLYYAVYVILTGINGIVIYEYYFTSYPTVQYFADFMTCFIKVSLLWSGLMLLYMLDYGRVPRWRFLTLSAIALSYIISYLIRFYIFPGQSWPDGFSIVFFVCNIDGFISVYHLICKKRRSAWLVAAGVSAVTLSYFFALDDTFHVWSYGNNAMRVFTLSIGDLILPVCLSLYLALDFSKTTQSLAARLKEVEILSAAALSLESEKREMASAEARKLELMVQQRTAELKEKAEKLHELDAAKFRLFTNIAHEFRTPLTLIINPARELLADANNPNTENYHKLILGNAERLLQLINQLMELSKLEHGLMELSLLPLDLVALIYDHLQNFETLVVQKGISLHFRCSHKQLWVLADREKLDKIFLNIISNAVKFTDTGRVDVFLQQNEHGEDSFTIQVRDTGKGIPQSKLPHIFTRFYQVDPAASYVPEGSGIGLAIAKELVELMDGQILVKSWEGAYTEITVLLTLPRATAPETEDEEGLILNDENARYALGEDDDRPVILFVEDHLELRDFVRRLLADRYRVYTATNGTEGIALGMELVPALIITDVMMPGQDGYQLCRAFKEEPRTSHIPVVMLTAKADSGHRLLGIETGADAYLGKPFDKRELMATANNLIILSRQRRDAAGTKNRWLNDPAYLPSIEQAFMKKIQLAVEKHLDDAGYGTDQLATEIGLSRIQLHRKLKAVIGTAPGELIRVIRLQYAHALLQNRTATVAEVAYQVGFSNPASFSASFSRHFGFPPKMVTANPGNAGN
ncbi:response regulator [Mucilaginibacter gilvus]|uniref:histidine kinase n=1 Tax=Mucilaginibacter gilvus TaxID=2305909 RepID=A0A444MTG5_9SPHI|nr:response regulator [Mucilaginibacter gilvus]